MYTLWGISHLVSYILSEVSVLLSAVLHSTTSVFGSRFFFHGFDPEYKVHVHNVGLRGQSCSCISLVVLYYSGPNWN